MTIASVNAVFNCDECGQQFKVQIDTAGTRPLRWSVMDIAEDALRGEIGMNGTKHRCTECMRRDDAKHELDCNDLDCSGCRIESEPTAQGAPVDPAVAARLDLRRPGETAKAYAMRKGIR